MLNTTRPTETWARRVWQATGSSLAMEGCSRTRSLWQPTVWVGRVGRPLLPPPPDRIGPFGPSVGVLQGRW